MFVKVLKDLKVKFNKLALFKKYKANQKCITFVIKINMLITFDKYKHF